MFNLHTHTIRCHHASGTDREYVEQAIKAGYTEMGFSDHAPMIFPSDSNYVSHFRMSPADFEGYVNSVLSLKEEYASDIKIYLGLEAEYYPALFEKNLRFYCDYPIDYLIQGQHFIGNEYDLGSVYPSQPFTDENLLRRHIRQTLEGMATGAFTYVAHPDLANFVGDKDVYRYEVERLCCGSKEYNVPLEINFLGFNDNRNYPNRLFWEVVHDVGCDVVVGLDAHSPEVYANGEGRKKLEKWIKKLKIKTMNEMPILKNPREALK